MRNLDPVTITYAELEDLQVDAERYRWLRSRCRSRFDDTSPDEPQVVYLKRSNPYLKGYADRVDSAVDAAMAEQRGPQDGER